MGYQIRFYYKSRCDNSFSGVSATASEASSFAQNVLTRSNLDAWITTGSVDANNTTLTVDFGDAKTITEIFLILHNFKAYTVKYWNGSSYVNFSTPIAETTNTATTTHYSFTSVSTQRIQLTITGTMVANSDKSLCQLVATQSIGQISAWPVISKPTHVTNIQKSMMLSGKTHLTRNAGGFTCELKVKILSTSADLAIIETLYDSVDGFLVWLCGGSTSQFSSVRKGYRLEDLYLMKCMDDYVPEFYEGLYKSGIKINMKLGEVVT